MDDIVILDRAINGSEMAALADAPVTQNFVLPENAVNGSSAGVFQGGDIDNDVLIYSIESQTHTGAFTIDPVTGEVSVGNSVLLDFESDQIHEITVRVSDGQLYDEETYEITLIDAPESVQSVPANQAIDEDGELTFSTPNGNPIFVSDGLAAGDLLLRVQVTVNDGVLTLSGLSGVTIADGSDSSNSMTLIGTDADIRNALDGSKYIPDAHYNGNATLDITTSIATLDGLSGRYTFAGAEATDHSVGSRQDGAFIGDAKTTIDPDRGEVLSLDGNGGHVSIAGLFGEPENATLSAWVNLSTLAGNAAEVISLGNNLQLRIDATSTNGNGITLAYRNGDTWERTESNVFIAGTGWNHVAATYDNINNVQSVYLNGTVIATTTRTEAITYDIGANTIIGAHGDGSSDYNFNGQIDDVQIYSRALSEVEIAELASGTGTSVATNLTEVSGSTAITVNPVNDDPVNIGSLPNDVTVTEDLLSVVDLLALNLADFDAGSSDVTVTLTAAAGGQIALSPSPDLTFSDTAVAPAITGTITDLNAYFDNLGNIQYRHGNDHVTGDNADSIAVSISDNGNSGVGGGSDIALGTVNVDISAVNDEQLLATNLVATIAEGSTGNVITPALLQTSDVDHAPEELVYTVTAVPANGMLLLNGTALAVGDAFTQANINAGVLTYDQDGSQTSADAFGFTVDDGSGTASSGTFNITINNVNDAPVISVPGPLTVDEDVSLAITGISVTDDDDNLSNVRLMVNSGKLNVTLSGTVSFSNGSNGSSDLTLAGSLADINDTLASLSYQGNLHFNGGDTLTVLSTDSSLATSSDVVNITVNPVNDDPVNSGTLPSAVTVFEDVLSDVDLSSVDFGDDVAGASNLTVSLSTVTGGELTLASDASLTFAGTPTAPSITGQLSDLNAYFNNPGNIQYLHSTTNINGNNVDTITVAINDNGNTGSGGGADLLLGTVNVDISAVNDEQVLVANIGINVAEGSTGNTISPALLLTADIDHTPEQLNYTVTAVPAYGMLLLRGSALATSDTFTQADISAGVLTYDHDGTQTSADAFSFSVDDGAGTISAGNFDFTISNVNDAPALSVPGPLSVDEDMPLAISGISVTDDDDNISTIQLTVFSGSLSFAPEGTAAVTAGTNGSGDLTLSGTLGDINTTLESLSYQGSEQFHGMDTLTVLTTDSNGAVAMGVVNITVNSINDDPVNTGTVVSSVTVIEDVQTYVDLSSLEFTDVDADTNSNANKLTVSLSTQTGGELTLAANANLSFGGTATARTISGALNDLNAYFNNTSSIQYLHGTVHQAGDNADQIRVVINDNGNSGAGGGLDTLLGTIRVDITPVNDPPSGKDLVVPVTEDVTYIFSCVDFGFTDSVENDNFHALSVVTIPQSGHLDNNGTPVLPGTIIDIADIYAGHFKYTPAFNATDVANEKFTFRVYDSGGINNGGLSVSQSINLLTFDVLEANAPPQREFTELTVDEGQSIILSTDDLIATDPDDFVPEDLIIVITSLPVHGVLTLDGNIVEPGTSVNHDSLQRGLLRYLHDGSETSSDQFDIQVSVGDEEESMPATTTVRLLINEVIDPAPAIVDESLTLTFGGSFDSAKNDLLDSGTSTLASQLTSQDADLIVSLESAPLHGTVSIDNKGALVYVHDGSATLQDSFQYRVTNLDGVFSVATVNVSVEPPIESAFARPDEPFVERAAPIDRVTTAEEPAPGSPPVEEARSPEEFDEELQHLFGEATTTARMSASAETSEATLIDHNEIPVPMAALPDYLNDELGVKQHNRPGTINLHNQQVAVSTASLSVLKEIQTGALHDITGNSQFANALQQLDDDLEQAQQDQSRRYQIASNTQLGVSFSVTAGILAWFLRGGALFASALASTPLWSFIDPVRVFVARPTDGPVKNRRDQDHDELEKYFDDK